MKKNIDSIKFITIGFASIILAFMYSLVAMLIVEVVYSDEMDEFLIIKYLVRLTPELSRDQRIHFLSRISKRQITSTVSLMACWIVLGDTHHVAALVFVMTLITMFTLYGIYYVKSTGQSDLPQPTG